MNDNKPGPTSTIGQPLREPVKAGTTQISDRVIGRATGIIMVDMPCSMCHKCDGTGIAPRPASDNIGVVMGAAIPPEAVCPLCKGEKYLPLKFRKVPRGTPVEYVDTQK